MPNRLSSNKVRICAAIEKKLVLKARVLAKKNGTTLTDIIREAITQYVGMQCEKKD